MIKSVIFDLGGVCFTDGTGNFVRKVSKKYNLDEKKAREFLKSSAPQSQLCRKGKIKSNKYLNMFKGLMSIDADNKILLKMWAGSFRPISGIEKIIKALRKKKIRTFILSDSIKENVDYLERKYRFVKNFDGLIFSYKMHKSKFDGAPIFKIALKQTKNKPEEVIFIDDKERCVKIGRKLGMASIHFKNSNQLRLEFKKLKLL